MFFFRYGFAGGGIAWTTHPFSPARTVHSPFLLAICNLGRVLLSRFVPRVTRGHLSLRHLSEKCLNGSLKNCGFKPMWSWLAGCRLRCRQLVKRNETTIKFQPRCSLHTSSRHRLPNAIQKVARPAAKQFSGRIRHRKSIWGRNIARRNPERTAADAGGRAHGRSFA